MVNIKAVWTNAIRIVTVFNSLSKNITILKKNIVTLSGRIFPPVVKSESLSYGEKLSPAPGELEPSWRPLLD